MINSIFGQHKKIFYAGVSLALAVASHQSAAQELGLDNFVRSILNNNPGVQKILADSDIAASALESSLGVDDGVLTSSIGLTSTEPNQILGVEPDKSDDTRISVSYDRLFSDTGTRLSLGYANQYTSRDPASGLLGDTYYQPSFTMRLTQPLLKNSGGIQDQLNIKLSELNFKLSVLNSKESLESYITQLSNLYIDWYLALRELTISKEVHRQSIEQEKLTRTKVKRQVSEPYELLRAQEIREDYFSRWQQALGRYTGLTHQIPYQMNLAEKVADDELAPVNPVNSKLLTAAENSAREKNYLTSTSRLKAILDAIKQQQLILLDAKDNSRSSDLNLSFGYTLHGADEDLSGAYDSSLNRDDISIVLEYKLPLGNRKAGGEFRSQLAKKRQIESDTRQRMIDASAALANLEIQSSQLKLALQSVDRKIILGEKKLKKEQYLYEIGKLDLFELLKDQTSHLESRLNRERLYTQQMSLQLKIGELLDRNLAVYSPISKSETDMATGK